jgi:sugar lactone lactonase YvrE
MHREPFFAAVFLISWAACLPNDAAASSEPLWRAELSAQRAADPGDLGAAYFAAYLAADGGDSAGALQLLEALEPAGWAFPLLESDFPKLLALPRFQVLAGRLAARAPRGGPATLAYTIGPADLLPEGIACDARSGAVFLGSRKHRKIVRVAGGGKPSAQDFVAPRADLGAVLGLHVDAPRRLLWAAHNPRGKAERESGKLRSGIVGVDLESGAVVRSAALDGAHLLNDIAIAGNGVVYITDSEPGAVWRLPAGGAALERVVADGTFMYPNGIVWLEDRRTLIVADVTGLHLLDPANGARRRVARGPAKTLGGVDGLLLHGDQLIAVQNGYGGERVVSWQIDRKQIAVTGETVLQSWDPRFAVPTTACVRDGQVLFIANSYAGQSDENGNPKGQSKLRPAEILSLPLPPPSTNLPEPYR